MYPEGHFPERARRPDGVQMTQQHQGLNLGPDRPKLANQEVSGRFLSAPPAFAATGLDPPLDQGDTTVHRCPVFRRGFQAYQLSDHFAYLRLAPGDRHGQVTVGFHQLFSSVGKPNTLVVRLMARSVCRIFDTLQRS